MLELVSRAWSRAMILFHESARWAKQLESSCFYIWQLISTQGARVHFWNERSKFLSFVPSKMSLDLMFFR